MTGDDNDDNGTLAGLFGGGDSSSADEPLAESDGQRDDGDDDSSGLADRLRERAGSARARVSRWADVAGTNIRGAAQRAWAWCIEHRLGIRRGVLSLLVTFGVMMLLRYSWGAVGPVATILYVFLFIMGFALLPTTVALLGKGSPNALGVGYWILASFAYGRPWLVEHNTGWEMHAGRERDGTDEVYIDGTWYEISDTEYQTVLGWRPFGLLLQKDSDTLQTARVDGGGSTDTTADGIDVTCVDDAANGQAVADGSGQTVTRGDVEQAPRPDLDELDYPWLLDLKRYWSRGIERMGDISVIGRIEEVKMRQEAEEQGRSRRRTTMIGTIVGLVLGMSVGYVAMFGI